MSGDDYYVGRAPASERGTILANLATMRQEAGQYAVTDPSLTLSLDMADQYAGTLTVATYPAGLTGTATLSDAVFADGSSSRTIRACC